MRKRRIVLLLLTIGMIGGYASGFASLGWRAHARHERFERHIAGLCADAARAANAPR